MPLPVGQWVDLRNEDRVFFVYRSPGFTVSTTEETFTEAWAMDEDEQITEGKPRDEIIKPIEEKLTPTTGRTPWDFGSEVAKIVLNGPDGVPNALWWLLLFVAVVAISWLKYN